MRISPDGRFSAWTSNLAGRPEVVVTSLTDEGKGRWQVSPDGGLSPAWSPRGGELFYMSQDGRVMAVPYRVDGDTFQPGKAQPWAEARGTDPRRGIDVTPDGKRYLSAAWPEGDKDAPKPEAVLLLGFFEELKRRLAGGK
jgi:Tol biopolymer transport system component